jgi:hypothetical protein
LPATDLQAAAVMLRYGVRSLIHNLKALPPDRLDWKPSPGARSALEAAGEVVGALRMYLPILCGEECRFQGGHPHPANLEEAERLLTAAAAEYAAALEAAGPALDGPRTMPFGAVFQARRAVLFPVMDLFHHHGQVCYLQTLLGDPEMHWDSAAIADVFEHHAATEGEDTP